MLFIFLDLIVFACKFDFSQVLCGALIVLCFLEKMQVELSASSKTAHIYNGRHETQNVSLRQELLMRFP